MKCDFNSLYTAAYCDTCANEVLPLEFQTTQSAIDQFDTDKANVTYYLNNYVSGNKLLSSEILLNQLALINNTVMANQQLFTKLLANISYDINAFYDAISNLAALNTHSADQLNHITFEVLS